MIRAVKNHINFFFAICFICASQDCFCQHTSKENIPGMPVDTIVTINFGGDEHGKLWIHNRRIVNILTKSFLEKKISPNSTIVSTDIYLNDVDIDCNSDLHNFTFKQPFQTDFVIFKKDVNFSHSDFENKTSLHGDFNGRLDCRRTSFEKGLSLKDSRFANGVDFSDASFSHKLDLSGIEVYDGSIYFNGANLPDTIECQRVTNIKNTIDFTHSMFFYDTTFSDVNYKHYVIHHINLSHSAIDKIKIDYYAFRLFFDDEDNLDELKESTYKQLLKNFQDNSQLGSYKVLDIEYHHYLFDRIKLHWLGEFFYYWWEFGYAKERIFAWIFAFISVFTFINIFIINFLIDNVYEMDNIPLQKSLHYYRELDERKNYHLRPGKKLIQNIVVCSKYLLLRLWYSFAYTCSIFFRLTLKIEKLKFGKWYATFYLMIVYIFGLLSLAYLANYVLNK